MTEKAKSARYAGLVEHHVQRHKDGIRNDIIGAEPGKIAVTITEHVPLRWKAAQEMIEAGELIVLSSSRGETRRGPPAADGKRRVRREVRVTLAGWDPISREFHQKGEDDLI